MQIPPDQNTRAEAMWRIISQRVDFRSKRVIDLGCGTGDFLWRPVIAGAKTVMGGDIDLYKPPCKYWWITKTEVLVALTFLDINSAIRGDFEEVINGLFDIAFCFSVLPYLDDVPATLKWMSSNFPLCLIECQYAGDGPGLPNIGADKGMMQLLFSNGFDSAIPLGRTYPEDRTFSNGEPVYRTIWLCETKE